MSIGTQLSDMTPIAFDDLPDDAQFPWVTTTGTGGYSQLRNYRSALVAAIRDRVTYTDLAATTGAALVGTTGPSNVQADLNARPTSVTLAAAGGSNLIGFQQAGTGAVLLMLQGVLRGLAVTPEQFGAVGDGTTDDTAAVQKALNTGRSVMLLPGHVYSTKEMLTMSTVGQQMIGGGTLKPAADFEMTTDINGTHMIVLTVSAANCTFDAINFDVTVAPTGTAAECGCVFSTAAFTAITNCYFVGNPRGTCILGYAGASYMSCIGNRFKDCSGAVFVKGRQSVITDNIIINPEDAAIAINGTSCVGTVCSNNTISNEAGVLVPSMIAVEEGAAGFVITGNILYGVRGGGIICTNILSFTPAYGGVIANNLLDGKSWDGTTFPDVVSPATMLNVSRHYYDVIIHDNRIVDCPEGNSNSRYAILPATGTRFHDNIIDGSGTSGLSALIDINPGNPSTGMVIEDNKTISAGARHFLFGGNGGDADYNYDSKPCVFIGGEMDGGTTGIDAELNFATMPGFILHIRDIQYASMATVVNGASAIGHRAAFLNAGAVFFPHRIGTFTEMRGSGPLTTVGNIASQTGDKIWELTPTSGAREGVVKIGPTWFDFGSIT